MTTTALAPQPADSRTGVHRFTLDEYDRMVALGAFPPEMRVELLEGLLVDKMPNDPPHASTVAKLAFLFSQSAAGRWQTRCQLPVRLPQQNSEPEPDLALLVPRVDFYATRHPLPADIFLLIEVADSSVERDREEKLPLYAQAGVAEYWIVNLPARRVEIYREPKAAGNYALTRQAVVGETIAPAAFPDAVLTVADLLPVAAA